MQMHADAETIHFSSKVKDCFHKNSIQEPNLLEKEYSLSIGQGLKYYPALFVNGQIFRGDLQAKDAAQEFICSGIENSGDIAQCMTYTNIKDDEDKWVSKFKSPHQTIWFWLSCGVLLIIFIFGLFIYRRNAKIQMQKEIAMQVDTAIQQYYALSDSK